MKIVVRNAQSRLPITRRTASSVRRILSKVCELERYRCEGQVHVTFVSDRVMRELNLNYLGLDVPTDVLAFDLGAKGHQGRSRADKKRRGCAVTADIIISADTAASNARFFNTTFLHELCLYSAHGMLHICGYDDSTELQKKMMQERAGKALLQLHLG